MRNPLNQAQKIMCGALVAVTSVLSVALMDSIPAYASSAAPDFMPLSIVSGVEIGTVRLVGVPLNSGDSLAVAINSTSQEWPADGSAVPANAIPYSLGMDIAGLDKQTNRYLDVYEVKNNQVTAFHEFDLSSTSGLNLEHLPISPIDVTSSLQYNPTTNQWQVVFDYTNPGAATTIPYGGYNINIETPNFRSNQPTNFPHGSGSWGVTVDPTGANGAQTADEWVLGTGKFGINSLDVALHLTLSSVPTVAPGQTIQISGTATNGEGGGVGYVPISLTATSGTVQQNNVVTELNGNFSFDWTASMTPGPVTFRAVAIQSYLQGMTVTAQSPSTVSASSSWTHIVFNPAPYNLTPSQTTTVTGTVYDSQNQPLSNATVNLYASSGTFSDNAHSMTLQTNAAGQFSSTYGAPATAGPVSVTAQLSNTNVVAATSFMINSSGGLSGGSSGIGPPVITTTTLPSGTVGQPYSESLQANGLEQGDTWSLARGSALPQGLTLGANGIISGVPSSAGNRSFSVMVTSSVYGASTPQSMGIDIQPAPATGGGSSGGSTIVGPPTGGSSGGSTIVGPPTGGSSGGSTIVGPPTGGSSGGSTIVAPPTGGSSGGSTIVGPPTGGSSGIGPPVIITTTLPSGTVGQPYSESLQANGLEQGDTWSLARGSALPQGLTLGANGIISGVPSSAGNRSFSVMVTSPVSGASIPQSMGIDIQPAPANGGGSTIVGPPVTVTYAAQTLAKQSVSIAGGDLVYHGRNVTFHLLAPRGSLAPGSLITLETPGADVIQEVQSRLTGGTAALLYFGVKYSAQSPSVPSILTVTDPNIPVGARVYEVASNGTLIPVRATVASGQIQMPMYETSNFVVTAPIFKGKATTLGSYERVIDWQGKQKIVPALVKYHTTYMPVRYLANFLQLLGIQSTWNGRDWNLSSTAVVDLSYIRAGAGDASIYLNKTLVQKMNVVIQIDPSTNQPITYMPIWYVMQVLKCIGIHSSWNGTTWTVTRQNH